ncbi:MAG: hypothetical protein EOM56_13670 [Deltaproteobacteria bacterium]|nr:hypothetical protein [Deltaproteobacteria bacterium]
MRSLTRRLEALEGVHAEKSRPAPIGVALIPFLPGESYAVDLPEGRKEFGTQEELFAFLDGRGPWEGLLLTPGLRSESEWLAAVAQA